MFGLSFWRHPFTAEHPLVKQWWMLHFSKSDEETNSSTSLISWGWVYFQQIFIFWWLIPLISRAIVTNSTVPNVCMDTELRYTSDIWWLRCSQSLPRSQTGERQMMHWRTRNSKVTLDRDLSSFLKIKTSYANSKILLIDGGINKCVAFLAELHEIEDNIDSEEIQKHSGSAVWTAFICKHSARAVIRSLAHTHTHTHTHSAWEGQRSLSSITYNLPGRKQQNACKLNEAINSREMVIHSVF